MVKVGEMEKLQVIYGTQKSYGSKALTRTDKSDFGTYHSLFSYGIFIIEIKEFKDGSKIINALTDDEKHFTSTTLKHLNEFVMQHGMEHQTKKEWYETWRNQINYAY